MKKTLALLLATAMTLTLLAGCSKSGSSADKAQETKGTEQQQGESKEEQKDGEKVTITF